MQSGIPDGNRRPITRRAFGRAAAAPLVLAAAQGALVNSPVRRRPGRATVYLNHDRHRWAYHVHAPKHVTSEKPLPVVVILHGSGSEGPVYLDRAGWASEADRAGFLAVAPDAQRMRPSGAASNAVNPRRWNSGQLPPGSQRAGIDDVGFLLKMLDDLGNRWAIDPNRVYVAGHSNGGSMAFKVVDEASEKFAAMASVGGHCYVADPAPAVPLPTVFMLGSEDPLMPLAGGRSVLPWEIRDTPPFRWTTDRWAEALGAAARPTKVEKLPDATRMVFGPVPNGAELVCLIVLRQGHNWPGAPDFVVERAFLGPNRSPVQATPNLWAFFDKYERG